MKLLSEPPIVVFLKLSLDSIICGLSFIVFSLIYEVEWDCYLIFLFSVSIMTSIVISKLIESLRSFRALNKYAYTSAIFIWLVLFYIIIYILFLNIHLNNDKNRIAVEGWLFTLPIFLIVGHVLLHNWLLYRRRKNNVRKCVIAGGTKLGALLAKEIENDASLLLSCSGFFDSRELDRIDRECREQMIGGLDEIMPYLKDNDIQTVLITLPIKAEQRIIDLLNDLRDTTVSVYFVPDIFIFDLIQSSVDTIHNIPVVSVLESPIHHFNAVWKTAFDLFLSSLIIIAILPVLLFISIGIKLFSSGPVLFKQTRYGLDGKPINVYKFRTMNIQENGDIISQATRNDPRTYPFGAFLRSTSLDELPQFFNVILGDMSIVGPRPHAVVHNEEYRKIIHGYMLRHTVKPGITGWAQVHGFRGETDTLDKMEMRIQYDLEYLKNWSLVLDIWIIFRTFFVVLKGVNAH